MTEGQPHDAGVAALDVSHRIELLMLNGVGSSLVQRVARGHIAGDFLIAVGPHPNRRLGQLCGLLSCGGAEGGEPAEDQVLAAPQPSQYGCRLIGIGWFTQHLAVQNDDGVGGDDELFRVVLS